MQTLKLLWNHTWPPLLALSTTPLVWTLGLAALGGGWWSLLALLLVPALVLLSLLFAQRGAEGPDSQGQHADVRRGRLPAGLWWLETPDERLPGGTYEPTVWRTYTLFGWYACALYWLGWRNQLHGLGFSFRKRLSVPWSLRRGYFRNAEGLWWARLGLGPLPFELKLGWRQYIVQGELWAVPCCTVTRV